jgi:hypothetical protein
MWAVLAAIALAASGCDVPLLPNINGGNDNANANDNQTVTVTHHLSVARHSDVALSASAVDAIFSEATNLLNTVQDECEDFACAATFSRDGDLVAFDDVDSVVTTDQEMDQLFDKSQDIKVVSLMIGVCGASGPDNSTIVLGCAFANGSAILAEEAPADVWAHEWGHVQGLPHRNNCRRNLMHATEVRTNAVNERERDAFLDPSPGSAANRIIPLDWAADASAAELRRAAGESVDQWLNDVVDREYLRGIPADVLSATIDPQVTSTLTSMLQGAATPHRYRNSLRLLGLQGDPAGVPAILQFLDSRPRQLGSADIAVMAEALLALGRLADADATGQALAALVDRSNSDSWDTQGFQRTGGSEPAGAIMARLAVMALGHVNDPQARAQLESLGQNLNSARVLDRSMAAQIHESLQGKWRTTESPYVAAPGLIP